MKVGFGNADETNAQAACARQVSGYLWSALLKIFLFGNPRTLFLVRQWMRLTTGE
jgi:hypothetical protein